MVGPVQGDLFRGLRLHTEPSGKLRLEGTVNLAAAYTGLSRQQIYEYIEQGEITARSPGEETKLALTKDVRGRRRGFKKFLDMRDVFRIAYGEEEARKMLKQLGVDPGLN
jgi:excisionase family DNA binding protein